MLSLFYSSVLGSPAVVVCVIWSIQLLFHWEAIRELDCIASRLTEELTCHRNESNVRNTLKNSEFLCRISIPSIEIYSFGSYNERTWNGFVYVNCNNL